eukprot:CAMPEP_0113875516 /NCGR_PEP_ID=MMETSP0780_2-20120614/4988_1 /TAXON_ID=652834 /ORGANISM="Palpitomonas bilix" /LENGTH=334 /DNA_ID=CAMNT_0000861519 /DNA_START=118 /DNA_END=1122 /DNA_ORIENTATION=+ /assembly_acc=CAM_ASM_000599
MKEGEDPRLLCSTCAKKFDSKYFCTVCGSFYDKKEMEKWVGCDRCPRWVHRQCVSKEGADTFKCPDCGWETSLSTLGGPNFPPKKAKRKKDENTEEGAKQEKEPKPKKVVKKEKKAPEATRSMSAPLPVEDLSPSLVAEASGRPMRKSKEAARDRAMAVRMIEAGSKWGGGSPTRQHSSPPALAKDITAPKPTKEEKEKVQKDVAEKKRKKQPEPAKPKKQKTEGKGSMVPLEKQGGSDQMIVFFVRPNPGVKESEKLPSLATDEIHSPPSLKMFSLKKLLKRRLNLECGPSEISLVTSGLILGDEHSLDFVEKYLWNKPSESVEIFYSLNTFH